LLFVVSASERAFLIAVDPLLAAGDLPTALARLRANWPPERLEELTASSLEPVTRLAATCLGLTGGMEYCRRLVALLGHADEQVAVAAEDALWNIWMRAGSAGGSQRLNAAVEYLRKGEFESALEVLDVLIASEPALAEARHQQALALHSLGRHDEAEAAYQAALERNPYHFAAIAGLGHICVERDEYAGALDFYERALKIHPRLAGIREIVPQLEAALHKRDVA
jgi:tetratricopeptide (TPR) repeat protein